jgi:hypothetical protein
MTKAQVIDPGLLLSFVVSCRVFARPGRVSPFLHGTSFLACLAYGRAEPGSNFLLLVIVEVLVVSAAFSGGRCGPSCPSEWRRAGRQTVAGVAEVLEAEALGSRTCWHCVTPNASALSRQYARRTITDGSSAVMAGKHRRPRPDIARSRGTYPPRRRSAPDSAGRRTAVPGHQMQ